MATGIELAEALKANGDAKQASDVFGLAKKVAITVHLEDLVKSAEKELFSPLGDTVAASPLPGVTVPAAPKGEPAPAKKAPAKKSP